MRLCIMVVPCTPQVNDERFLVPLGKSKEDLEGEVNTGRFPPSIIYMIIYSSPEENRVKDALIKVDIHGANVPLVFCCKIKEERGECGSICECSLKLIVCMAVHSEYSPSMYL